ncbi:MAG: type II toxin-antitoxin system PemK/MazF family toxin [Verrucomicrobiales bacterium]|nr:type II toxin-antitoxin system PemK/MazF family toxin [Verrucomicrobiales bacterium]
MHKDYQKWMPVKARVNNSGIHHAAVEFKERDVWWMSIGENAGCEEDGKGEKYTRPVLVVRKFNRHLFCGVPLSITAKRGDYYFEFNVKGKNSVVLLSQFKAFDALRLVSKLGSIPLSVELRWRVISA